MTGKQTQLELLSPARDLECGLAAINHGADAVYIGAPKFGARAAAANPLKDISELISYAHRYWARVYITLNTILYDAELEEARALIFQLHDAGADALIIQDMGLLELDLPPIPLFASTQTHNYSLERIQFLERVGLKRVILARELSLKQVSDIRKATSLELEFFVHGALCVSFSGLCYFSQAAMGRSANRGECAQMCRLPYTLTDGRGNVLASNQHVLSLKDLNLSEYLSDLIDVGVTSFKIEGRLKDASYVKNVTAFYRAKLDAVIEERNGYRRASSGKPTFFFMPDPERTFHRGTTDYFLHGRRHELVSLHTPKSVGKLLGTIQSLGSGFFTIQTALDLHTGDGICFFGEDDELKGSNINRVEGNRIFPNSMEGIQPGVVVYRNYDREFVQLLKSDSARRTIEVDLTFDETPDGFQLRAVDEDGNTVMRSIVQAKEPARKPDAASETLKTQLAKLGETIFNARRITVELKHAYFLPKGVLNRLRRECASALEAERGKHAPRQVVSIIRNEVPYPQRRLDYTANVVNEKAAAFYRRHGVQEIEKGFELQKDTAGRIAMTTRYCLKFQFDLCRGEKGSAEEMYLADGKKTYKLDFDCEQCVMKVLAP